MLDLFQLAVVSSSVIIEQVVNVHLVQADIIDIIDAGAADTFNEDTLVMTITITYCHIEHYRKLDNRRSTIPQRGVHPRTQHDK